MTLTCRSFPSMALFAALLLTQASASSALPKAKDKWVRLNTQNFTIYSNAQPSSARQVGNDLEQFRLMLSQLSSAKVQTPIPTAIYVFSDGRSFKPYKYLVNGKPAEISAYFSGRQHGYYIALTGGLRSQTSSTVYSLYAYEFLHNNVPGLPLWFRKGLAEYYGTFEFDKRRANIGKPDIRHVDMLRQNPMIPLAELFATETHPDYRQGLRARMFDAQSWALVHYLLTTDPARRDKTLKFIDLTLQGVPQDTAFARAFDTNYPALQNEVESYIRQFKFGYQRYDLPPIAEETGEAQPLAYSQVLYRLGDLLTNQQSLRPEAAEHFRAALQEDPANALALAGLGFLAERQEQWPQAIELYRKAAAQAPDDFLTQYRFGYGLLQQPSTATAAEAKEALRRSVAANPKFAPAWAALNYAYTFDPASSADAIEAGKTAHGLLPSRKDVAQNLLYHFVRAGEREPAKTLVDRFFALQGTAAELADARAQVAHLDLKQAWDHLQAEETDDAERIVEAVSATPLGGEGGLRIAQQLRQLRQDIAGQRFFKHLNEAVDRFNAGDFAGAETILEELLAGDPQIHGAEQARELLAAVKEQLGRNDG